VRSRTGSGHIAHAVLAVIATVGGLLALLDRSRPHRLIPVAAIALFATISMPGFADWARRGGAHVADDASISRAGMLVRRSTTPDTRIAVVWAGALPYFAHRPAVDLLGRNDSRIARMRPAARFGLPGHNKFDYAYSIGALRPDLILQLWMPPPELFPSLAVQGYEPVSGWVFARRDATGIDRQQLRDGLTAIRMP
jgi:hypothetical protein